MRSIVVYCVVDPENNILLKTIGESKKQSLHEFDLLKPIPWPVAEQQGFRVEPYEMKPINA